jgi:hypothetical protein
MGLSSDVPVWVELFIPVLMLLLESLGIPGDPRIDATEMGLSLDVPVRIELLELASLLTDTTDMGLSFDAPLWVELFMPLLVELQESLDVFGEPDDTETGLSSDILAG